MQPKDEKGNNEFIKKFFSFFNRISFISSKGLWFVLIPLAVIASADQGIYLTLLEQIQKDVGGYFVTGVAEAAYIISIAIFTIIFGYFADKYDRKWILFLGSLVGGVFYLLTAFTFSLTELIIIRIMAGMGIGCVMPVAFSMISDSISTTSRSKAFSFWGVASFLGNGIGAIIGGGYVVSESEYVPWIWHEPFIYIGIFGIIIGIFPLIVKEPKRGSKEDQLKSILSNEALKYSYRIKLKDLKNIYKRKSNFWLVANFIDTIAPGLLVAYILPYFVNYMTFDIILLLVLLIIVAGLIIGNFGLAFLAEIGINLGVGLTFTFGIGPNWYGTLIDVNLPENRGTMIATATFLDQIGRAIGTVVGGYLAATFSLMVAIQSASFFMLLSIFPWFPVLKYIRKDLSEIDSILSDRADELKKETKNKSK
ncbi:MAG: MFS transporter [Candidatus Helarchaeota archaeon]